MLDKVFHVIAPVVALTLTDVLPVLTDALARTSLLPLRTVAKGVACAKQSEAVLARTHVLTISKRCKPLLFNSITSYYLLIVRICERPHCSRR